MIKTLTTEAQVHLATAIVQNNLESAIRLMALVLAKVDNNYEPIPSQHIKQDVEAVYSALKTLNEVFTGKLEFKPNPQPLAN